ncbi:uncharacterized protein BDZ99DRAFT_567255 [Mytilinidion resinicola]|uniref:Uncharacterized protein n=1 Tax=Mytilinidion resinicola TaxID=574789 RepID=A0A6A6Z3U4_9PEZI|nr:uncharacterized protein BDZ99DRAFT_567255 [Mytilinidion resinicola]KAF2815409.1 hypothetical protein BDZ99DRAFT_567255 [Mytilinidion resinicola]
MSLRGFQIKRNPAITDSYDPCAGIEFDPPRDSDELFDALKAAYPRRRTHKARIREAIIEFLVTEREASRSRSGSPVASTRDSDRRGDIEHVIEGPNGAVVSDKISRDFDTQGSKKESTAAITRPDPTPATTRSLDDGVAKPSKQTSQERSIAVQSLAATRVAVNDLTIVWSSVDGLARNARVKRIMTDEELEQYRLRRVIGACKVCKAKKRKCNHGDRPPASPPDVGVKTSKPQAISTSEAPEASARDVQQNHASVCQSEATQVDSNENRGDERTEKPLVNTQQTLSAHDSKFDSNAWILGVIDGFTEIDSSINALGCTKSPPPLQPAHLPAPHHPVVDLRYPEPASPIRIDHNINIPRTDAIKKPHQAYLQNEALSPGLPQFISPAELDAEPVSQLPIVNSNIKSSKSPSKLSALSVKLFRKSSPANSKADHADKPKDLQKAGRKEQSSAKNSLKRLFSPRHKNPLDDLYLTEPDPHPKSSFFSAEMPPLQPRSYMESHQLQPHGSHHSAYKHSSSFATYDMVRARVAPHEMARARFPPYEMALANELDTIL